MGNLMSDHQESEHFSYERTWEDIQEMLRKAEFVRNRWETKFHQAKEKGSKKETIKCARNMKALEGVIKTLRWTLGDKNISHPLD